MVLRGARSQCSVAAIARSPARRQREDELDLSDRMKRALGSQCLCSALASSACITKECYSTGALCDHSAGTCRPYSYQHGKSRQVSQQPRSRACAGELGVGGDEVVLHRRPQLEPSTWLRDCATPDLVSQDVIVSPDLRSRRLAACCLQTSCGCGLSAVSEASSRLFGLSFSSLKRRVAVRRLLIGAPGINLISNLLLTSARFCDSFPR